MRDAAPRRSETPARWQHLQEAQRAVQRHRRGDRPAPPRSSGRAAEQDGQQPAARKDHRRAAARARAAAPPPRRRRRSARRRPRACRPATTPSGGRISGRIAGRKKTWTDAPRMMRTTAVTSRTPSVALAVAVACALRSARERPIARRRRARQEDDPPTTHDARKPSRAAAIAPTSGPITCPTVIADWAAATCRRTSPRVARATGDDEGERRHRAHEPRRSATTNSSGSVRAAPSRGTPRPGAPGRP